MNSDEIDALDMTFEIDVDDGLGNIKLIELIPDGRNTAITIHNKSEFINLYTEYLLDISIENRFNAFKSGFLSICDCYALNLYLPDELEQAICGRQILDTEALERSTRYQDGFTSDSLVIRWFWEIVHGFSDEKKKKLLSFVTGSDRIPIRGFDSLDPRFTISKWVKKTRNLPVAHTCFNHLLLPEYQDKLLLQRCLETAIENSEGFGLK